MEPISILMSALSLGGVILKPVVDQAVKDAYAGLKRMAIEKFGQKQPMLAASLDQQAQDPRTWNAPVEKMLKEAGADQDQEIVRAAEAFLTQAEAAQPGITGGVAGQINAGKIGVVGTNYGSIDMRG